MELPRHLTVLVVDDQSSMRVALAADLDRQGHRVLEAGDADYALELFQRHRPDLVLLDVHMPGKDGYWLAHRIREIELSRWTPVIFLSSLGQDADLWRGIEAGGDDYLVKPVSPVVLAAKLRAMLRLRAMQQRLVDLSADLRDANERLRHLSDHDGLTGLLNRRGFDQRLHDAIVTARADGKPLTLILCDIDHFKAYNDRLGHIEGDKCLQRVGTLLRDACLLPRGEAARYGGEEFALILPDTAKSGAMTFGRALQRMVRSNAIAHPGSTTAAHLTLSGGITTVVPDAETTVEDVLARADQALYVAKSRGRDLFFSFEMQMDSVESAPHALVASH